MRDKVSAFDWRDDRGGKCGPGAALLLIGIGIALVIGLVIA